MKGTGDGAPVGRGSGDGKEDIEAEGKKAPGNSARLGKPLTLGVKGQESRGDSRPGVGAWGAVGAVCTLREEGRGARAGWARGKFDFRPGRFGALEGEFRGHAQPLSQAFPPTLQKRGHKVPVLTAKRSDMG